MNRAFTFVLAASLAVPGIVYSGEHPSEHPKGHEHPAKAKKAKKEGKWVSHKKTMNAFVKAVNGHVDMKTADEGSFKVFDDKLDKTWELKLVRIHTKRIARLAEDKFFACADFKTMGDGKKIAVDLDFFVTKSGEDWNVDEVLVHKVSGKPRYTYNANNERVPVKAKMEKKKGHEHPTGHEHPRG